MAPTLDITNHSVVHNIIHGKVDGVKHETSEHFEDQRVRRDITSEWLTRHFNAGRVEVDSHAFGRWKVCSDYGFTSHKVGYETRGKGKNQKVFLVHILCTVTKSKWRRYTGGYACDGAGGAGGKGKMVADADGWVTV